MSYKNLKYEVEDRIAIVTVNRPKVLNAMNAETNAELKAAALAVSDDDSVSGMIVTGEGEKAFMAGAGINELAGTSMLE